MWTVVSSGVLVLALVTQTVTAKACNDTPNNSTTTTPGDPFTTRDGAKFRVDTVLNNLDGVPWSMEFAPDGRLFVTERVGRVLIVNVTTGMYDVALQIPGVFGSGEAGLLGLALDPAFTQNHLVYLYYTAATSTTTGINRLVRYRETGSQLVEGVLLLDNIPASNIHDGGRLKFGPDGLLYLTTGDAATQGLAQDVSSLAGKILRLNRDGTAAAGNRFSSPVFTYGHRNPQGIDWHPTTGIMLAIGKMNPESINVGRNDDSSAI